MSVQTPPEEQLIRFEDVTPARNIVAFFAGSLKPLVAHLNLPVYLGYDDLDELLFTFLTLPSGKTVTLGQYRGSPQVGVDLYVDSSIQDVPAVIYESCQQLGISHSEVTWLHADVQEQVDRLYAKNGDFAGGRAGVLSIASLAPEVIEKWPKSSEHEPIQCFQHSFIIYDQQMFPEFWATLQQNLGIAYRQRKQGDREENLEEAIKCLLNSQQFYRNSQQFYRIAWIKEIEELIDNDALEAHELEPIARQLLQEMFTVMKPMDLGSKLIKYLYSEIKSLNLSLDGGKPS
jgi:hypothetical protein